jgi:transcription-repair coupling factor (superfamily II helicase)
MMARSSRAALIIRSAQELGEPVRVTGATPAALALIAARFALASSENDAPILVLCPNDDSASEFAADIEALSALIDRTPLLVCHFPTWEQSAYSPIAPSLRTRLARVSALTGLVSPDRAAQPRILVTTIAALCQATVPRATLTRYQTLIERDGSVESRETLLSRLTEAGYLRVDPVEDPGTYSARGDIIDVFPPDRERPVRIELFGDVIERIREFDPATQRAMEGDLVRVTLPPAREVLINRETVALARERVRGRADDLEMPRPQRDPILAGVQAGNYPDHSDAWAPFSYPDAERLWDYLPAGTQVLWNDELACQQEWDAFHETQKRLASDALQSGVIAPAVDALFPWQPELEKNVRRQTRLFFDRLEMANVDTIGTEDEVVATGPSAEETVSPRHRVFVRDNGDLSAGSKHALGELEPKVKLWLKQGFKILALASTQSQRERIRFLLEERGFVCHLEPGLQPSVVSLAIGSISQGFRWPAEGLVVVTESEILGARHAKKQRRQSTAESGSAAKNWSGLQALSDLAVGDAVVHIDHGIGRYQGLARLSLGGAPADFLQLEYASNDKLYLPVYRLNVIQKYVGAGESVALDRLGAVQFAKAKEKVRDAVKRMAIDLIKLYAERKVRPGIAFSPRDSTFREFEASFPFDETNDQLRAIDDILGDMESGRVSDRLVCGDVGYGKTEVAIRAAFRAVTDGKQVAVLVPTTVLAFQHEQSFRTRMKDYPISIGSVSRFKSAKEQKTALDALAQGKLDIVIGTHRLLSRDVTFKDLGLIIVDEEHRFGVEHKEKLKTLKTNTHVLTLTATPIPRTLHMALSGLRDISLINTPPVDRLPIRTYVSKYDDALIQRAIQFELNRGGQVFFLHNRVDSIYETATRIRELVPQAVVGVGHGQMGEGELEEAMVSFYQRRTNVLVCTTIIESGIDLPNANTILINRADALGLAQLYQIRGRVGRGQQRAYAYLLIPAETAVTGDAKKRLEVIQRFVELGSGFSIASHDLEIRGGGDLLGAAQSGHIAAVGFDLYTELLEEAIREIEGQPLTAEDARREPEIKAPFPAFLSEEYVPDVHQRLSLYRRFSAANEDAEVDALEEELRDRYGELPLEAQNLMWLIRIKILLKRNGIDTLTVGPERVSLVSGPGSKLDPVRAISMISGNPEKYQLTPDSKFVARIPTRTLRDLFFAMETLFKDLAARRNSG